MYISLCPELLPRGTQEKIIVNNVINCVVSLAIHTLAAYLLGMNPMAGLALGAFVQILEYPVSCCSTYAGGCAGAATGGLLGGLFGCVASSPSEGAKSGSRIFARLLAGAALLASFFITYFIGMRICNAIPSLGYLNYSTTLLIMALSMGMALGLRSLVAVIIMGRASSGSGSAALKEAIAHEPACQAAKAGHAKGLGYFNW